MSNNKEIYTGLYAFGDMSKNSFIGGVSARIMLPDYSNEIKFFLNDNKINSVEKIENVEIYNLNISELESIQKAIERLLNDMRKLKSLSQNNLLRDEAYSCPDAS